MPGNTTSNRFFYTYVLESQKDGSRHVGYSADIKRRMREHQTGRGFSTSARKPFKLIYFEGCLDETDAKRRENYLKTSQGRRFLGLRLINYKRSRPAFGIGN